MKNKLLGLCLFSIFFFSCSKNNESVVIGVADGAVTNAVFVVSSDGSKVCFSQGNLLYNGYDYQFAESQYASQKSVEGAWTELFNYDEAQKVSVEGWRMLSKDEWEYIINNYEISFTEIGGINGLLILPSRTAIPNDINYASSHYLYDEWIKMQAGGAVFLPASGYTFNNEFIYSNNRGRYWSNSELDSETAYRLAFDVDTKDVVVKDQLRSHSYSIRLVKDIH